MIGTLLEITIARPRWTSAREPLLAHDLIRANAMSTKSANAPDRPSPKTLIRFFLGVLLAWIASPPVGAQTNAPSPAPTDSLGYNLPPDNILSVMRSPSPPVALVSPTDETILLVSWQEYPSIARVATPFLRLAGARVEPKNHSKHDTRGGYGITPCATGFELVRVADGKRTPVPLPTGMCPGNPVWAADGKRFAFVNIASDSVQLWIGDASTGSVKQVPGVHLNPMFNEEMQWMPDQKTLLVKLVPKSNDGAPQEVNELSGPSIQETNGQKGQSSTYEARDTLSSARDENLFDYFALSQLAFVDSATLTVTPFGKPANYNSLDPAPDGHHILVTTIHKPYSYLVTYDRFPKEVEVWDTSDRSNVTVHTIASLPMADRVPIHGVPTGRRSFSWRSTEPATLIWAEALDGGDWKVSVPNRDKILLQKAPFILRLLKSGAPNSVTPASGGASNRALLYWVNTTRTAIGPAPLSWMSTIPKRSPGCSGIYPRMSITRTPAIRSTANSLTARGSSARTPIPSSSPGSAPRLTVIAPSSINSISKP